MLSIKSVYSENHLFGDIPALYYISYSTVHEHKVSKNETSQISLQAPMGTCPKADTTAYNFFFLDLVVICLLFAVPSYKLASRGNSACSFICHCQNCRNFERLVTMATIF